MDTNDFMPGNEVVGGIRAEIKAYEEERARVHAQVRWRVPVFVGGFLLAVLLVALWFNSIASPWERWSSTPHVILYFVAFVGVFFIYQWANGPAARLQKSFRERVFPRLFGFIENFAYSRARQPASFARLPRDVVGAFNRQSFDDVMTGSYEGVPFELYEATLSQKSGMGKDSTTTTLFRGVIVAFETVTPFPGVLVATQKSGAVTKFFRNLFGGKLKEVASGVAAIDAQYDFRTDNPDAATPLVTGRLPQAMTLLREAWPEQPARVALAGPDGFLLVPTRKNFFELPKISVPLDYAGHIQPIVAEMATMLATASLVRQAGARGAPEQAGA